MTKSWDSVDLSGEPGWKPIESLNEARTAESYVSGEPTGRRLRIRYFRRTSDDALVGRVWFGPGTQGPPGHAHGGSVAALLDEAMGFSAWTTGHRVLAAHIEVDFKAMVPLGSVLSLEARVEAIEGRKVRVAARLELADGEIAAEATGMFLQIRPERLDALAALAAEAGMNPEAFG